MRLAKKKLKENLEKEYQRFKEEMLMLSKEELFENSYRIEIMKSLYRILQGMVEEMAEDKVMLLSRKTNPLGHLFQCWLSIDDCYDMELKACVELELHMMKYRKEEE